MAFTGFFLCLFLVIHLFGNLQLLLPAEVARWQFNFYSKLLSENIFIELISYPPEKHRKPTAFLFVMT